MSIDEMIKDIAKAGYEQRKMIAWKAANPADLCI
jgi:hypothetical protein